MATDTPAEAPAPATSSKGKGMWIGLIVVVIVIVILLAAVFGGLLGPPEEQVLKIGTVVSITGRLSVFGPNNRNAAIMAVEEITAETGGVLGRPVQLFHQNDATDAATARSAATTLVSQNRVDAIIGATGSGQCKQVLEIAKSNSVFEVSGSCTSPEFSNTTLTGGWWARTAPSDSLQGAVAAYYAYTNLSFRRAAVMGTNDAYGRGLAEVFAAEFASYPGASLTTGSPRIITPTPTATDYTLDLEAVLEPGGPGPAPDIVYLVAYPDDGVLMVKNWQDGIATHTPAWGNVFWLFSEGLFDQGGFVDKARLPPNDVNVTAFEGTAPASFGGVYGPGYAEFAQRYRARWGVNTTLFDDNYYDAAALIVLATQAAGTATGPGIKSKISAVANPPGEKIFPGMWREAFDNISKGNEIDYEGVSGAVNIDSLGDPTSGYIVWGVNDTTNRTFNKEYFNESFVVSLLPAPPAPAPGTRGYVWTPAIRADE